jgi:hypothetical protein
MRLGIKSSLAVLFLLAISSVNAQVWDSIAESENGTEYLYDPNSVTREGDLVKFWELKNYLKPQKSGGSSIGSSKIQLLADCKEPRYQIINIFNYSKPYAAGDLISTDLTGSSPWYKVVPESVASSVYQTLCKDIVKK